MTNPLAGKRNNTSTNSKSLSDYFKEIQKIWERQDKQLAFEELMNRLKRGVVAVEEINRLPKNWKVIALERGYIRINATGGIEPRHSQIGKSATPWKEQPHVAERIKRRESIASICGFEWR